MRFNVTEEKKLILNCFKSETKINCTYITVKRITQLRLTQINSLTNNITAATLSLAKKRRNYDTTSPWRTAAVNCFAVRSGLAP
jgi:hypothetical protein